MIMQTENIKLKYGNIKKKIDVLLGYPTPNIRETLKRNLKDAKFPYENSGPSKESPF